MTAEPLLDLSPHLQRPSSFSEWRARLDREQIAPVVAVAGSRGKTSVLRVVESILRASGYRLASWTDHGVEIEGQTQRGELGPWSRALTRLRAGGLDVALQEIDWTTVRMLGAPGHTYPIVAVANLCANNEACLITPEISLARKALSRVRGSVATSGRLILNADDFAVSGDGQDGHTGRYLVGISADTPVLRRHLREGGDACWLEDGMIVCHEDEETATIAEIGRLHWTRAGAIPFAVQNALIATAIARSLGLSRDQIGAGLLTHEPRARAAPGSFNLFDFRSATVVVDRPAPPWFLRTTLRAVANLGSSRFIRVAGPMVQIPSDELTEVGRLLGRGGGVLLLHGDWRPERLELLRLGASSNGVPPIILQAVDEPAALQQAIEMLRPDDVLLVLAEDAPKVVRLIERRARRIAGRDVVGAA